MLYGDMADPEIHDQLPLNSAHWVVSTVRSKELNLALLQQLKNRGYKGRVAVTATNQDEVNEYETTGANVVFRPFADAAEQAVDALTYAMEFLTEDISWPINFREVRISSDASVAGSRIKDIPLRAETGVSILAVNRAGRVYNNPGPDFQIYPGDRLVIMGTIEDLRQAELLLKRFQDADDTNNQPGKFILAEIDISDNPQMAGQTLAEIQFRQKFGVTVVGIRRGEDQIVTPASSERLTSGDRMIVIGDSGAIELLKGKGNR